MKVAYCLEQKGGMNQLTHQKVNFQRRLTWYDHAENIKIEKIHASTKARLK